MPAKGTVNVGWQIVFVLLPITSFNLGGFWAAFRIKKLQKFVIVYVIVTIAFLIYDEIFHYDFYESYSFSIWSILSPIDRYFATSDIMYIVVFIIEDIVWYGTFAFFIKRWSKSWNARFDRSQDYNNRNPWE